MRWAAVTKSSAFVALILTAACGPVPIEQAERECAPRGYLAAKPQTTVGIRFNSDGTQDIGGSFGISTDYIAGRDPNAVFRACVANRSGQITARRYTEFPNQG